MAGLYASGKASILSGGLAIYQIRAIPVTAGYTPDLVGHTTLADVPSGARAAAFQTLTGQAYPTFFSGQAKAALNADDVTFPAVPSGDPIVALLLYLNTGSEATDTLVAWLDYFANLPLTPDGRDVVFTWPDDDNKIFSW